jgi:hypothetical protein
MQEMIDHPKLPKFLIVNFLEIPKKFLDPTELYIP